MGIEYSKKNLHTVFAHVFASTHAGEGVALLVKCLQSQHDGLSSPVPMSKPGVLALVCNPHFTSKMRGTGMHGSLEFICQSAEMIYELQV